MKKVNRPGRARSPSVQRGFYLHKGLWWRFKQKARSLGKPYNSLLSEVLKDFLDSGDIPHPVLGAEWQGVPISIPKELSDRLDREANRQKVTYSCFANRAIHDFLESDKEERNNDKIMG
jgi:hypothetical protein